MTDDERDGAIVDELLAQVARNRETPVPEAIVAATRAEVLALRSKLGAGGWNAGIIAAMTAARRKYRPLVGRVAQYVASASKGAKQLSFDAPVNALETRRRIREMLTPKEPETIESDPDGEPE